MHNFWTILIQGPHLLALDVPVVIMMMLGPFLAYALLLKRAPSMSSATKRRAGIAYLASVALFLGVYVDCNATVAVPRITVPTVFRELQTLTDYQVVCRWNVDQSDHMAWSVAHDRLLADDVKWRTSYLDMTPHARTGKDVPCKETPVPIRIDQVQTDLHAVNVWMIIGKIIWLLGCAGIGWSLFTGLVSETRLSERKPSA
ncbi:hypothetical protein [Paraburkholderia aromaticivorans]|uniref:Uncharacterized protein n=1 Tax=Paraburkholderia aromaticivorans TaxID=2026199 RepID=A0A248VYE5_9BURK|nr:hypothetical protein [Paraburkholderia aromaticivorans]ASW03895.1 hypothetical protein CJU94_37645 [Paraburkholderia aromaticivorans]